MDTYPQFVVLNEAYTEEDREGHPGHVVVWNLMQYWQQNMEASITACQIQLTAQEVKGAMLREVVADHYYYCC